ncbi:MAG: hypothetical protein ABI995_00570 [Acidobacteriota bacterium]
MIIPFRLFWGAVKMFRRVAQVHVGKAGGIVMVRVLRMEMGKGGLERGYAQHSRTKRRK